MPNSTIKLLKNVPLDDTYEHTAIFPVQGGNHNEQYTYFNSFLKPSETYNMGVSNLSSGPTETINVSYTLENYTYQRSGDNTIRVQIPADCLYDCNYCMYRNTAFGSKWFYAFIKNAKYINTHVTELTLIIDVMQTWFISNCVLRDCFVEREHASDDTIGANIIPENLEMGDEYEVNSSQSFNMNDMNVCVLITRNLTGEHSPYSSTIINGIYTPTRVGTGAVTAQSAPLIDADLDQYQENEIISIYQYPSCLGSASSPTIDVTGGEIYVHRPTTLGRDSYSPKNNKLLTYPYVQLLMTNNCGNSSVLRWEDSQATHSVGGVNVPSILLKVQGTFLTTPCVICSPIYYRGFGANIPDYASGITYSNFPQCAWSGDTFKAWWAQNKGSFVSGVVSESIQGALSIYKGQTMVDNATAPGVGGQSAANMAANGEMATITGAVMLGDMVTRAVGKITDIKNTPSAMYGQVTTDCLNPALGRQRFDFFTQTIKSQYAKIIDDYFTKYGYATHRVKTPNLFSRTKWNYLKTIGCLLEGDAPADAVNAICNIIDAGITFWHVGNFTTGDYIGKYSMTNSIVS